MDTYLSDNTTLLAKTLNGEEVVSSELIEVSDRLDGLVIITGTHKIKVVPFCDTLGTATLEVIIYEL